MGVTQAEVSAGEGRRGGKPPLFFCPFSCTLEQRLDRLRPGTAPLAAGGLGAGRQEAFPLGAQVVPDAAGPLRRPIHGFAKQHLFAAATAGRVWAGCVFGPDHLTVMPVVRRSVSDTDQIRPQGRKKNRSTHAVRTEGRPRFPARGNSGRPPSCPTARRPAQRRRGRGRRGCRNRRRAGRRSASPRARPCRPIAGEAALRRPAW